MLFIVYIFCIGTINSVHRVQRNLTKVSLMVSICFFACWSWNSWYFFLMIVGAPIPSSGSVLSFTVVMVCLHCCINPFIYIIKYDKFRSAARKLFHPNYDNSVSQQNHYFHSTSEKKVTNF